MDQLKGILSAFMDLIEKLVGDNESLKGIIDTVKQILGKLEVTEETAA